MRANLEWIRSTVGEFVSLGVHAKFGCFMFLLHRASFNPVVAGVVARFAFSRFVYKCVICLFRRCFVPDVSLNCFFHFFRFVLWSNGCVFDPRFFCWM